MRWGLCQPVEESQFCTTGGSPMHHPRVDDPVCRNLDRHRSVQWFTGWRSKVPHATGRHPRSTTQSPRRPLPPRCRAAIESTRSKCRKAVSGRSFPCGKRNAANAFLVGTPGTNFSASTCKRAVLVQRIVAIERIADQPVLAVGRRLDQPHQRARRPSGETRGRGDAPRDGDRPSHITAAASKMSIVGVRATCRALSSEASFSASALRSMKRWPTPNAFACRGDDHFLPEMSMARPSATRSSYRDMSRRAACRPVPAP
jgi:hypothetical protein